MEFLLLIMDDIIQKFKKSDLVKLQVGKDFN